jgi:hypothetical protein
MVERKTDQSENENDWKIAFTRPPNLVAHRSTRQDERREQKPERSQV